MWIYKSIIEFFGAAKVKQSDTLDKRSIISEILFGVIFPREFAITNQARELCFIFPTYNTFEHIQLISSSQCFLSNGNRRYTVLWRFSAETPIKKTIYSKEIVHNINTQGF